MIKLDKRPVEEIAFLDHCRWNDNRAWDDANKLTLCPSVIRAYGVVVEESSGYINVAATIAPVANKVSGLQCIVTAAIISRRVILEPESK